MEKPERQIVELIRSLRHEWMNQLHLLKANLSLKKYDRAEQIIDDIIERAKQEARLTNLNAPKLAALLLTYNWKSRPLRLEIEAVDSEADWSALDDDLTDFVQAMIDAFERSVAPFGNHVLTFSIKSDGGRSFLALRFTGEIRDFFPIEELLDRLNQTLRLVEKYMQTRCAVFVFAV
jgi:stage 0 sporulation protein B (sporulation initiation phosphotransferase)